MMRFNHITLVLFFVFSFVIITSYFTYAQDENNTNISCGNGICELNETIICPQDCNNCTDDTNCTSNDKCIIGKCEGTPKNCIYGNKSCSDNNPITIDKCIEGNCFHDSITNCTGGDGICPLGCDYNIDTDCPKPNMDECYSNEQCKDPTNPCRTGTCSSSPKKCSSWETTMGCIYENSCVGQGNIVNVSYYCGIDNQLHIQKGKDNPCSNGYECATNTCSKNLCMEPAKEPGIIEKIFNWIATLFGIFISFIPK